MSQVKKAVLPVAGMGTRFYPITKSIPKEMLPIVDRPLIQFAIDEAINAGIEEIIFVTNHTKDSIKHYVTKQLELNKRLIQSNKENYLKLVNPNNFDSITFSFVEQKEPLGFGHAVLQAKDFIDEPFFAILLADDLVLSEKCCLGEMIAINNSTNDSVLGVFEASDSQIPHFGIVELDGNNKEIVKNIIEKPDIEDAPSNLAVFGRYILSKEIFDLLEETQPGKNGEIQLTDAMQRLLQARILRIHQFDGMKFDCGSKKGYVDAIKFYAENYDF